MKGLLNKNNINENKTKRKIYKTPFILINLLFYKKNKDTQEIKNKIKDKNIKNFKENEETKNKAKN